MKMKKMKALAQGSRKTIQPALRQRCQTQATVLQGNINCSYLMQKKQTNKTQSFIWDGTFWEHFEHWVWKLHVNDYHRFNTVNWDCKLVRIIRQWLDNRLHSLFGLLMSLILIRRPSKKYMSPAHMHKANFHKDERPGYASKGRTPLFIVLQ